MLYTEKKSFVNSSDILGSQYTFKENYLALDVFKENYLSCS